MKKEKIMLFLQEAIPFFTALILNFVFNTEIGILIIVIFLLIYTFAHKYERGEIILFIFGTIIGIIIELTGNIALNQKWGEASFFIIPIWLPIAWGYGFIVIRRIGNLFIK